METLEEKILKALIEGPKEFDVLKKELGTTDEELTSALEKLESSKHIQSNVETDFFWALVPMTM